jgi:hypothetical protein
MRGPESCRQQPSQSPSQPPPLHAPILRRLLLRGRRGRVLLHLLGLMRPVRLGVAAVGPLPPRAQEYVHRPIHVHPARPRRLLIETGTRSPPEDPQHQPRFPQDEDGLEYSKTDMKSGGRHAWLDQADDMFPDLPAAWAPRLLVGGGSPPAGGGVRRNPRGGTPPATANHLSEGGTQNDRPHEDNHSNDSVCLRSPRQ